MARRESRTSSDSVSNLLRGDEFSTRRARTIRTGAGFTIVELLIVVIVIAILAAITLVAFNGITNRAKASAASAAAEQAAKKVAIYAVSNGDMLPNTLPDAGISDGNGTSYQYRTYNNGKSFCITATANSVSAFVNNADQTSPAPGACEGHGANGATVVTNLVVNPSVESNASGWGVANGATCTRQPSAALVGSWGMYCTTASSIDSGANIPVSGTFNAGTTYTASLRLRSNAAATYSYRISAQGPAGGACLGASTSSGGCTATLAPGESATLTTTWTPTATGSIVLYALRSSGQGTGSASFDVDGVILTVGNAQRNFADGSSPGWIWNGVPGNSTSTGPAQ